MRAQELRRTATPAERRLWRELSASKLGWKFSRQMPVGPYIADFLCRSCRVAVELDGYSHDLPESRDAERDAFMRGHGVRVLRFTNREVFERLEGVVEQIRAALAASPPPAPPACGREGLQ